MLHNLKVCGFIFSSFFVLVWIFHRTMPSPAPNITLRENGRERREGERERVLFTLWADLRFTVIQLHRGDNSCLYLKDSFSVLLSLANLGFTHSHDFDAQVNLPHLNAPRSELKKGEEKRKVSSSHSPPPRFSFFNCSKWSRSSESCPGRRQRKAKAAPRAPRHLRAAGGRGKVWPQLLLRPPGWSIPADHPSATAESFMTSPSRWAQA